VSSASADDRFVKGYLAAVAYLQVWHRGARTLDIETFRNRLGVMERFAKDGFPFFKGLDPETKKEFKEAKKC